MTQFDYLIDKIQQADFSHSPFKHLLIEDFFHPDDFKQIISAQEIHLPPAANDRDLFEKLFAHDYKIISFPGCIEDKDAYIKWHRHKDSAQAAAATNTACEGFGITLRLSKTQTPLLQTLKTFIEGEAFNRALADKFGVAFERTYCDGGIQKYLDGYEISPHPDIRKKALTFMVNINPSATSESQEHHTHYLTLNAAHRYVQSFWEGNPRVDRCWIPWSWCETSFQQRRNNSIVIFAPSDDTLHGVKAAYDHLPYQRTQLYGNLWYQENAVDGVIPWERLALGEKDFAKAKQPLSLRQLLPQPIKNALRGMVKKQDTYLQRTSK